jgi:hypothetical protein
MPTSSSAVAEPRDGFLTSFDSPASAIKCARGGARVRARDRSGPRIGLHTGE